MVRWWKQPKDTRPYKTPFEPKVFGAWPASQVTMAEDLAPSIWPGRANVPPWGFIKLVMPGTPDISGDQNPKNHHIHMTGWKIHMRYLSMTQQKVMTVVTPFGPRYFLQSKDWEQHQNKEQAQLLRSEWVKRRTEKQLAERAAEINAMLTKLAKENQRPKTPNGHPDLFA